MDCKIIGCAIALPIFLLLMFGNIILESIGGAKIAIPALIVGALVFFIWLIFSSGETPKTETEIVETPEEDPLAEQTVEVRIK